MPTRDEWKELLDRCTIDNYTMDNVQGVLVIGPNGNSIFLPFAGYKWFGTVRDVSGTTNEMGNYWSGTNNKTEKYNQNAISVWIGRNDNQRNRAHLDSEGKFTGYSVRAVKNK